MAYPVSQGCLAVVRLYRELYELLLQGGALPLQVQQPAAQPLKQATHPPVVHDWVVVHLHTLKVVPHSHCLLSVCLQQKSAACFVFTNKVFCLACWQVCFHARYAPGMKAYLPACDAFIPGG